jgi:hypothetical protein
MIHPTDLVLIAVLNNLRDFEVVRLLGWYRIPLRYAPKVIAVDVLAFYQTAEFGDEKWSIRYAARVQGVELVKRSDLFQEDVHHPRAREEYYKLQLGALENLPHAIASRAWHRITFFYTSGDKLLSAREIHDLAVPPADRETLWNALRDRTDPFITGGGETANIPWPEAWQSLNDWLETGSEDR